MTGVTDPLSCMTPQKIKQLRRSMFISTRIGAVYFNNPKVACSSVKRALQLAQLGNDGPPPPKNVHSRVQSPLLNAPPLQLRDALYWLENGFTFSVVRHPLDRLKSAYLNKIDFGRQDGRFREYAGFRADYRPTYEEFLRALMDKDPNEHNTHWRAQSINLCVDRVTFDALIYIENFEQEWSPVAAHLGLADPPPRIGRRARDWRKEATSAPDGVIADIVAYFGDDFRAFGYSPDRPKADRASATLRFRER